MYFVLFTFLLVSSVVGADVFRRKPLAVGGDVVRRIRLT
jgi:hypothetical protein